MSAKARILILIKGLNLGGAERLLVDALPYLDRERFDYHLAYMMPQHAFLVPQFQNNDLPVHCLGVAANAHFAVGFPRLFRLQKRQHFDLIHAHLPMTGVLARSVGHVCRIPVVYTEHNLAERSSPLMRRVNGLTYGWNDLVLPVSQAVTDSIARLGWDRKARIVTLPNGVPVERIRAEAANLEELRQELDIPAGHLVVGAVAVFSPQKRLDDWLQVARVIAGQRQDVTFLLAGYGPEEAALRAKAEALGLTHRLCMPGFRPDGRRLLGLVDVYLMTSEFEGLPIALLEAMALGRPVVATSVGGIPEAVEHGRDGFLAQVGAVGELAGYTTCLLSDPVLRRQIGRQAAQTVEERFHVKSRIEFVEGAYRELLARRG